MQTLTSNSADGWVSRLRGHGRRAVDNQYGGTMVEFAVAVLLLVTVTGGIVDACRAIYADHYVGYAAAAATRYAMVRGSTWNNASCTSASTESCTATADNVRAMVKSIAPVGIGTGNQLTVATTWTGENADGANCKVSGASNVPGCVVQVQVSYNFSYVLPFLPQNALQLTSTSAVVIAQ